MSPAFQTLLCQLPTFSQDELKQIKTRVSALLGSDAAVPIEDEFKLDWLTEGILHVLKARGLMIGNLPLKQIKRMAPTDYAARCTRVRDFLLKRESPAFQGPALTALGRKVAEALVEHIMSWNTKGKGIGLPLVLACIDKVPEALDAAFPGYLESGLLYLIVRPRSAH
jgi:hypothetical protein